MGHGHIGGSCRRAALQVVQFQFEAGRDRPARRAGGAAVFAEPDPGADVGFVVAVGDDDFITGRDRGCDGAAEYLQQVGGRAAHDDFVGMGRVDQLHDRTARLHHPFAGRDRGRVGGAQLDAAVEQIVGHPLGDPLQHQGTAGVVHEDVVVGQTGKLLANVCDIEGIHATLSSQDQWCRMACRKARVRGS